MNQALLDRLRAELDQLKAQGLYKSERVIDSPQQAAVSMQGGREVINLCANNYLGLANHPELIAAAHDALDRYGYGMASVRFICGTQTPHKELEGRISTFLGMEDTILYPSCFDANGGLFETLLDEEDAVISDQLNHASIIDGIRLCKARRYRYRHNDMADLEAKLAEAADARVRLVATDGVFSMDGTIADLARICALAERYDATGFLGATGRGTHERHGVLGRVDIITGTLGKALGGASGGFVSARAPIVDWLRQRSRPYLFSNTVAPVIAATSIRVLDLLESGNELRRRLWDNTHFFRERMTRRTLERAARYLGGFDLKPGSHPISPVMLGDAKLATAMADRLLDEGVYVIGFSYPVVPHGEARIRTQMSAGHSTHHLEKAVAAFEKVGRELGVIG